MVKKSELNELKNMILWYIEGYKYFYKKYTSSSTYDEVSLNYVLSSRRVLNKLANTLLDENEIGEYNLSISDEHLDDDIKNVKVLFANTKLLNKENLMNKYVYDECMNLFLNDEKDDYSYDTIVLLGAGAYLMHKDRIEELTNKKIVLDREEIVPTRDLDDESLAMACTISNNNEVPTKESLDILNSLIYLYNYIKLVNNEKKKSLREGNTLKKSFKSVI